MIQIYSFQRSSQERLGCDKDLEIESRNVKLAMSHASPNLVKKVISGQDPLHKLANRTQVRHHSDCDDLAMGIVMTFNNPNARNNDFDVSTSRGNSVLKLAEFIRPKVHGFNKTFRHTSEVAFEHDVAKRVAETKKAFEQFEFRAETCLDKIFDKIILWIIGAARRGLS